MHNIQSFIDRYLFRKKEYKSCNEKKDDLFCSATDPSSPRARSPNINGAIDPTEKSSLENLHFLFGKGSYLFERMEEEIKK